MHTYRCPHCEERVQIASEHLGQVVPCPHCSKPFHATIPSGVLLEEIEGHWRPMQARSTDAERTLRMLRPAVFRRAPLLNCALLVLIAVGLGMTLYFGTGQGAATVAAEQAADAATRSDSASRAQTPLAWLGFVLALAGLMPLLVGYIRSRFETLTITNRRSIWRRGILVRNVSEVEHEDIRNIQVQQGVADQLLRVGRVSISSAGQNDMEISIPGVPNPDRVVGLVRQQQTEVSRAMGARPHSTE